MWCSIVVGDIPDFGGGVWFWRLVKGHFKALVWDSIIFPILLLNPLLKRDRIKGLKLRRSPLLLHCRGTKELWGTWLICIFVPRGSSLLLRLRGTKERWGTRLESNSSCTPALFCTPVLSSFTAFRCYLQIFKLYGGFLIQFCGSLRLWSQIKGWDKWWGKWWFYLNTLSFI